jgi:hypothetical protein
MLRRKLRYFRADDKRMDGAQATCHKIAVCDPANVSVAALLLFVAGFRKPLDDTIDSRRLKFSIRALIALGRSLPPPCACG